jgi:hypothetical protein
MAQSAALSAQVMSFKSTRDFLMSKEHSHHHWFEDDDFDSNRDSYYALEHRFLVRESFKTIESYHRMLAFFQLVQQDISVFHHLVEIQEILPPLMTFVFLPKLEPEIAAIENFRVPNVQPLRLIKELNKYGEIGWLLVVERMVHFAKGSYVLDNWGKAECNGSDTWGATSSDDFSNSLEDANDEFLSWSLTQMQEDSYNFGRNTAIARLDTLSALIL